MATLVQTLKNLVKEVNAQPVLKTQKVVGKYRQRIVGEILATAESHQLAFYLGIKIPTPQPNGLTD